MRLFDMEDTPKVRKPRTQTRKTALIVYVDKAVMDKPAELFDAAFAYFVKKGVDIAVRKVFMAQFLKAPTEELQMDVINDWVQVRDAATFPFKKAQEAMAEAGITEAEAGKALREASDLTIITAHTEPCNNANIAMTIDDIEEDNEDTATKGDIPVDDGADGKPESGSASK